MLLGQTIAIKYLLNQKLTLSESVAPQAKQVHNCENNLSRVCYFPASKYSNRHCFGSKYPCASQPNAKNGFFLWVFPDFPRKNNKIKSRNKDQTFVILTNKYTHIKYCLKYILHFACSYAKSLQFIGYCFKIPF
jgi:hypothetical protein